MTMALYIDTWIEQLDSFGNTVLNIAVNGGHIEDLNTVFNTTTIHCSGWGSCFQHSLHANN